MGINWLINLPPYLRQEMFRAYKRGAWIVPVHYFR